MRIVVFLTTPESEANKLRIDAHVASTFRMHHAAARAGHLPFLPITSLADGSDEQEVGRTEANLQVFFQKLFGKSCSVPFRLVADVLSTISPSIW